MGTRFSLPSLLGTIQVVEPATILRWHRAGYRSYWRWKSRKRAGRPRINHELRDLVRRMCEDRNPDELVWKHLHDGDKRAGGRNDDHEQRHRRAYRKHHRRGQCGLHGAGGRDLRHPELIAGVGRQGVFRHQLLGDLPRKRRIDPPLDIDSTWRSSSVSLPHRCSVRHSTGRIKADP